MRKLKPLPWLTLKGLACGYRYKGPVSDHFDGERFQNIPPMPDLDRESLKRWRKERKGTLVPWQWQAGPEHAWHEETPVDRDHVRVTFINHSTFLIQLNGLNILTDPVWSERVSPFTFAGPKRCCAPGIALDNLPPIDAIWLSHNHYDHCDVWALRELAKRFPDLTLYTPLGNGELARDAGIHHVVELDWWEKAELAGKSLSLVPAKHWGARSIWDKRRTLWGGFVYESELGPLYFAGDTGFGDFFSDINTHFGPLALSILPIGAFRPEWFMQAVHMGPDEALRAHHLLDSQQSIACHFGCFALADDRQFEPEQRLKAALEESGLPQDVFTVPNRGESLLFSRNSLNPSGSST